MIIIRRCLVFFWVLCLAIALSSCNTFQLTTSAISVPQIVITVLGDPKTFNYVLNQSTPNIFTYIYEGLVLENGSGEIEPALAKSWEVSPDHRKIIFTLRENLKWSDGEPLTADDVIFTYNDIYFNPEISNDVADTFRIGESKSFPKVRKLDSRRIEFTTPEPFAPLLATTSVAILPAHALQTSVKTKDPEGQPKLMTTWGIDTPPQKIISNGAYRLESYTTGERIILQRNPYYWRRDNQGNQQPYIQRFVWQIVESTDTYILQFRSGGGDYTRVNPEYFSLLKREEKRGKYTIYNGGADYGKNYISFNLNKGIRDGKPLVDPIKSRWFNTVEFRQAIAYAIDRQRMINNVYRGMAVLQDSPIAIQSPYYLSPEAGLKVYDYNLEKAKKLLLQAGFQYNEQGELLDDAGNRVKFSLITNAGSKIREAMGVQIQQDLSKIGIRVDFNPMAMSNVLDKLSNTLDWECYLLGYIGGIEPNYEASVWLLEGTSHTFNQKPLAGEVLIKGQEFTDWEKEIARLYIAAAKEFDLVKRQAIYAEFQQLTQEYLPSIYLVNSFAIAGVRDRVQGIKFSALSGPFWNIYELRLKDD